MHTCIHNQKATVYDRGSKGCSPSKRFEHHTHIRSCHSCNCALSTIHMFALAIPASVSWAPYTCLLLPFLQLCPEHHTHVCSCHSCICVLMPTHLNICKACRNRIHKPDMHTHFEMMGHPAANSIHAPHSHDAGNSAHVRALSSLLSFLDKRAYCVWLLGGALGQYEH